MKKQIEVKTITAQMLVDAGACERAVQLFRAHYGDSVSCENYLLEHARAFDYGWAADNLLSSSNCKLFYAADKRAWTTHNRGMPTAVRAARGAFNKQLAALAVEDKYYRTIAAKFIELYNAQPEKKS